MRKKWVLAIFLVVLTAGVASAQITISGGFALSYMNANISHQWQKYEIQGDIGAGGNIYVDYLLPIGIPLSLGVEVGVDTSSFSAEPEEGSSLKDTVLTIPILLRAAYHFDIHPKIDLYLVGKAGFALGQWSGKYRNKLEGAGVKIDLPMGFGFGGDLGIAYYFLPHFGIFAEGGFDAYMLQTKMSGTDYNNQFYSGPLDMPFYRFVTIGISLKF